jgi:hypothetical protein
MRRERKVYRAGANAELCRFFEEVKARFFPDRVTVENTERFFASLLRRPELKQTDRERILRITVMRPTLEETRALETALRTKAPAVVPASRCAPDPKSRRESSPRGKPRTRKTKRAKR